VLALGPTGNPVYLLLFEVIPGFWRVAKPETFFHLSWLALLAVAARSLTALRLPDRALLATALLFAVGWCLGVRLHPAYPPLTEPVPVRLAPTWSKALPTP
jgi:hypothetical protein